jgi:hypothetical protein
MSPSIQAEYEAGCGLLVARDFDPGQNPERRLYDLEGCHP